MGRGDCHEGRPRNGQWHNGRIYDDRVRLIVVRLEPEHPSPESRAGRLELQQPVLPGRADGRLGALVGPRQRDPPPRSTHGWGFRMQLGNSHGHLVADQRTRADVSKCRPSPEQGRQANRGEVKHGFHRGNNFHAVIAARLALCLFTSLGAQRPSPRVLVWGGDAEGGAPFVEADPADPSQVRGFDVEVAERIARGLGGRTARFVQVQWSNIDESVERGDFTLGLSGVEDTPTRRTRHAVTLPYFEFREVLAVRPEDAGRIHGLADLRGRRVATLGATIAYDLLVAARDTTGVIPVSYDDDVHPYGDLVAGRVDAVLLDHIIAQRALRRRGGSGFVILAQPVALGHYVGVLARANSALRDSVDAVLRQAMRDGTLEQIFRRWDVWDQSQGALFDRISRNADGAAGAAGAARTTRTAQALAYLPSLARAAFVTLLVSILSMALAGLVGVPPGVGR